MSTQRIRTPHLNIAYHEHGSQTGWPVILSHGFPYGPQAYDHVHPLLTARGARVIAPYLRGFSPTSLLPGSPRVGQQAALGKDIIELMDALKIKKAILAGFDWGGLASCVATILFPDRVVGLVSMAGYDVIDIPAQKQAATPELESVVWYQHLFQGERGRNCLEKSRDELCRLLWKQWSPHWDFPPELFDDVARSFHGGDFVDVVIHCYRHVFGNERGADEYEDYEVRLREQPAIQVPTVTIDGIDDPLKPGGTAHHARQFTGKHEHRKVKSGHAVPFEKPEEFGRCILSVHQWVEGKDA